VSGSFPQTGGIRTARARNARGELDDAAYADGLRAEVRRVVELQEELGLDVLVHGEPERNDMVQDFAEHFDGFAATQHGRVQSYGSRATRPSILSGDVSRPEAFTVEWIAYAQSLTVKPVKGMLTDPVTILAWSFVRDDQPLGDTVDPVALALADEIADLEAAGIRIVQVDEPALRELLPLRREARPAHLDWSVAAFRLATSGARPETQIHTHLCYSEFNTVVDAIDGLDADVTSIEAARSRMEVVAALAEHGFSRGIGPGVYDIHSPRVPATEELDALLATARAAVGEPGLRTEDARLRRDGGEPRQAGRGGRPRSRRSRRALIRPALRGCGGALAGLPWAHAADAAGAVVERRRGRLRSGAQRADHPVRHRRQLRVRHGADRGVRGAARCRLDRTVRERAHQAALPGAERLMLTLELARRIRDAGVLWEPAPGDRFTIDRESVGGDLFWISHLTIDVHVIQGRPVLGFNGTTEWALDSVSLDSALWLPREDQLRELLGDRLLALEAGDDGWVARTVDGRFRDPDAEVAYALALLAALE